MAKAYTRYDTRPVDGGYEVVSRKWINDEFVSNSTTVVRTLVGATDEEATAAAALMQSQYDARRAETETT